MSDIVSKAEVLKILQKNLIRYKAVDGEVIGGDSIRGDAISEIEALPPVSVIELTVAEAQNIAELIELKFYGLVAELYKDNELDNLEWAESILSGWRKLRKIGGDES